LQSPAARMDRLDTAATKLTATLESLNIRFFFIGGYAASLIGSTRGTEVSTCSKTYSMLTNLLGNQDLDIVVDADPAFVHAKVVTTQSEFTIITKLNGMRKLAYKLVSSLPLSLVLQGHETSVLIMPGIGDGFGESCFHRRPSRRRQSSAQTARCCHGSYVPCICY
jgi:hypothetical protein